MHHDHRRRAYARPLRRIAATITAALATAALVIVGAAPVHAALAPVGGGPVALAVPVTPPPGSAVINVKVSGDRIAGTPISASGVAGVTLRLSSSSTNANAWSGFTWATCTSDVDGDCNFVVPIKTTGSTDAAGMRNNAMPWVHQVSAPAEYRLNTQLRVGPGNGESSVAFDYRFQVLQNVAANTVYRSTNSSFSFMTAATTPNNQYTSSGSWQVSRVNPAMKQQCGMRYAVLFDLSGSINATELADAKGAVDTFVNALVGSPSQVALFNFDGRSPVSSGQPNLPALRDVRTTAQANLVKASYANWTTGSGTNWDAGLFAVSQATQTYDVVIVLTDGNPTQYGTTTPDRTESSPNRVLDDEAGIFSANRVKAKGSRVVAIGVGSGAAGTTSLNLQAISGPTQGSDYFQAGSYNAAATTLANLAKGNCDGTIQVTKRVIPASATIPTTPTKAALDGISAPAQNWTIGATTTASGVAVVAPGSWATDANGQATIPLKFTQPTTTGTVNVRETQQTGYDLQQVSVNGVLRNAICTNANTATDVPATALAPVTSNPGFSLTATTGAAIECTIYNRQQPASLTVTKQWVIDGTTYANGAQPAGLSAQLQLTGPGAAGSTAQAWGQARNGYARGTTATISETVTPGAYAACTATATVTSVNGQATNTPVPATGYVAALTQASNTLQLTNTITCTQRLTLVKAVAFGAAPASSWTLTAAGPTGALPGPSGTHSPTTPVVRPVSGNVPYTLSESGGPATYVQAGAWTCALTATPTTPVAVTNGDVRVPPGQDVTCTVRNTTATITLLKHVEGGSANPAAWNLTATPATMTGLTPSTVVGAEYAAGGNVASTFEVRPGHGYTFTEALADPAAPAAYRMARIEQRRADGTWIALADPSMPITAPAAGGTAVYRIVNEPLPPLTLPLTGGASTDAFLIAGGALLILTLVGASLAARRRSRMT